MIRGMNQFFAVVLLLVFSAGFANATKRKHHAHTAASSGTTAHTGKGKGKRVRVRPHVASPRLDPAARAELIDEVGTRIRQAAPEAIENPSALDGFYEQLRSHELEATNSAAQTSTVRVLNYGDSHIAADMFTGEARRVFQQQFGDGGIGYSYAGHPFAGYRILGSSRAQSAGWKTQGTKFLQLGDGELGMGGISISTSRAREWVSLDAPCTTLELQYLGQPGGGTLSFTDNGGDPVAIDTDASEASPGTYTYYCSAGDHHFVVSTTQNAPVTLLGFVATRPGVTWESIGLNGAEAPLLLKWDQKLLSRYLKDNSPALIVLAYGTNEAASAHWDEQSYGQVFANIIDNLHAIVPESSILVVGPSDRSTVQHRGWHPYEGTDRIVAAQRAVCRTHGCAFWDQRARMGGLGGMQEWVSIGWAQPDHTHFTGDGYRALADALLADLMNSYHAYKDHNLTGTEPATRTEAPAPTPAKAPEPTQGAPDGAASPNP